MLQVCGTKKVARYHAPAVKQGMAALARAQEQQAATAHAAWQALLGSFSAQHHATCRCVVWGRVAAPHLCATLGAYCSCTTVCMIMSRSMQAHSCLGCRPVLATLNFCCWLLHTRCGVPCTHCAFTMSSCLCREAVSVSPHSWMHCSPWPAWRPSRGLCRRQFFDGDDDAPQLQHPVEGKHPGPLLGTCSLVSAYSVFAHSASAYSVSACSSFLCVGVLQGGCCSCCTAGRPAVPCQPCRLSWLLPAALLRRL